MEIAKNSLTEIYKQLIQLQELEKIDLDTDTKPILNFGLCSVVYQWARGVAFKDIIAMTEFQEGSIVRCITRFFLKIFFFFLKLFNL
jgi:antiviral helicase SKI2